MFSPSVEHCCDLMEAESAARNFSWIECNFWGKITQQQTLFFSWRISGEKTKNNVAFFT
jgi:hypothetical protein